MDVPDDADELSFGEIVVEIQGPVVIGEFKETADVDMTLLTRVVASRTAMVCGAIFTRRREYKSLEYEGRPILWRLKDPAASWALTFRYMSKKWSG